tara:strand:- start:853 stop:1122 length:270 start_codon:yes stop_codon:yes gene_type:complete
MQVDVITVAMRNEDRIPFISSGSSARNKLSIAVFHAKACVKDKAVNVEFRKILVNRNFMLLDSKPSIVLISCTDSIFFSTLPTPEAITN